MIAVTNDGRGGQSILLIWEQQKSVKHRCKNGQSIVRFSECVNSIP